jgi:hypothetical protein
MAKNTRISSRAGKTFSIEDRAKIDMEGRNTHQANWFFEFTKLQLDVLFTTGKSFGLSLAHTQLAVGF